MDNVETQPLIDIVDVPVPPAPAASTVSSPEMSSDDRRSKYQNVKIAMGRGEETLLLGACHVPGETTETKETTSKKAAEFSESDNEAWTIPGCKTEGCQSRKVGEASKERLLVQKLLEIKSYNRFNLFWLELQGSRRFHPEGASAAQSAPWRARKGQGKRQGKRI